MGFFDLVNRRKRVEKLRTKHRKNLLKYRREERGRVERIRELDAKTREERAEATYYKERARRKAYKTYKKKSGIGISLPSFSLGIKKKKQRRKKSGIRLI